MNDGEEYLPTRQQDSQEWEPPGLAEYRQGFPQLGQRLLNRYEIFGVRQGGFGVVYFVTDLETNQDYAVKTYKPEFTDSLPSVERFKAEVDFWINLEPHPNIVKAHFVEVLENRPHLFMEYVTGGAQTNLRDWLRAGHFGPDQAIAFAYQLCLGMEFANEKGEVAHLDLKPENILIDEQAILKITDFGLAQRVRIIQGQYPRLDFGTWPYTAPERFAGQAEDTRSDIYAFGVILYEMLTGKLPYPFELSRDSGTRFKQLSDFHTGHGTRDLSQRIYYQGIPGIYMEGIGTIISGCLDYFQSERFRNFTMLREALEREFNLQPPWYLTDIPTPDNDLHSRALALYKIGRYSEALTVFNRLLQQHPNEGQLWLDAALVLRANGQTENARHFLQQAIRLDPTLAEAQHLLNS